MNIQNAARKFADERRTQQPHVSRQAHQLNPTAPQFVDHLPVVHFAVQPFRGQTYGIQPSPARRFQSGRLRPIADHDGDLRVQCAARHPIRNRFEVRPAAGEEYSQSPQRYSTRGRPRLTWTTLPIRQGRSPIFFSTVSAFTAPRAPTAKIMPTPKLNV